METVIKRGPSPGDVYELLNWDVLCTESTQCPDGKPASNTPRLVNLQAENSPTLPPSSVDLTIA